MRLICPNCGAQYEVDGDVIPVDGCDVQCSNCGHTWFESAAAPSARMDDHEPDVVAPATDATAEPEPETEADDAAPAAPVAAAPAATPQPAAPTPRAPGRTQLDPSIADILREEAAREEAARRSEGGGLEQQQDLGLSDPEPVR
ncbi:MAG: zinc-ribbon domain-containing protein, partial [Alphaproteobacteria bacterium]|nr:zinc-ribbon domain-containing protein [Alphaproteobacteria bacterium]